VTVGQIYVVSLHDKVYVPHQEYSTRVRLVSHDAERAAESVFDESTPGVFVTLDVLSGPLKGKRTTVMLSGPTFTRTFVPEVENDAEADSVP
jgi:hypothetical protein